MGTLIALLVLIGMFVTAIWLGCSSLFSLCGSKINAKLDEFITKWEDDPNEL